MKQFLLTTFTVLFISLFANSQITQGNWLVGGNASFTSTEYNSSASTKQKFTTLLISPAIGYFIADKFAAGLKLSFNSVDQITFSNLKQQYFSVGPYCRYYFLPTEKQANLFVEGNYQYAINISPSVPNQSSSIYSFSSGAAVFFNSSVAIEFTIGYSAISFHGYSGVNSSLIAGIGFQFHLHK
jgi:hypothetical protein